MSLIALPSPLIGEDLESLWINFFFLLFSWSWKFCPQDINIYNWVIIGWIEALMLLEYENCVPFVVLWHLWMGLCVKVGLDPPWRVQRREICDVGILWVDSKLYGLGKALGYVIGVGVCVSVCGKLLLGRLYSRMDFAFLYSVKKRIWYGWLSDLNKLMYPE